jgi:hypothetical protein
VRSPYCVKHIAIGRMFQGKTSQVFSVVKNLAAQYMFTDTPASFVPLFG